MRKRYRRMEPREDEATDWVITARISTPDDDTSLTTRQHPQQQQKQDRWAGRLEMT